MGRQLAPLFFAAAFYATLLLWDRLLPAFEPVVTGWFGEWGSFAMTLTIGYVLWRDIVSAYRFNLAFAAEYRQMERQLAMQVEYADQLAQRRERQQRDHDGELVGVDDPDRVGGRNPQLLPDGRQGDVGDGAVKHRQSDAERHGQNGPQAAGHRQSVRRRRYVGNGAHGVQR